MYINLIIQLYYYQPLSQTTSLLLTTSMETSPFFAFKTYKSLYSACRNIERQIHELIAKIKQADETAKQQAELKLMKI